MITVSPELLAHPEALAALSRDLLNLRFDGPRLTEALLALLAEAADRQGEDGGNLTQT